MLIKVFMFRNFLQCLIYCLLIYIKLDKSNLHQNCHDKCWLCCTKFAITTRRASVQSQSAECGDRRTNLVCINQSIGSDQLFCLAFFPAVFGRFSRKHFLLVYFLKFLYSCTSLFNIWYSLIFVVQHAY